MGEGDVMPWLKAMPMAPEFRPTEAEFADPIAYILTIEKEVSKYGICKIIPPIPKSPKKVVIENLNMYLGMKKSTIDASDLNGPSSVYGENDNGVAKFNTRQQQIGWSLKRPKAPGHVASVVQKSVWESGETYTLEQFEAKAKLFSRSRLKTPRDVPPLVVETLFWKATTDKPFTVEYANDIPGTAFGEPDKKGPLPSSQQPSAKRKRKKQNHCKQRKKGGGSHDAWNISNTAWNMRIVSRSEGSLLRHMPDEVPGVTSPMVYVAMLFSWFAWHVEDHDLHSLNYLHTGAPKTWYAVPGDAASAFEEVVRVEGYGGQVNPLVALEMLSEKTTVMSPEVLIAAGVPCCRLVQNAGEFVVTFPRAYHLGFSHGFNCGEAANLATPAWLYMAKEAAVRRAATKCLPMLSHQQLLYLLVMGFKSRIPMSVVSEPHSSRLKDRQRGEGEIIVKKSFLNDMIDNNFRLSILLQKASTGHAVLWNSANVSCDFPFSPLCSTKTCERKFHVSFGTNGMDVSTIPSEIAPFISTPAFKNEDSCIESSLKTAEKAPSLGIGSSLVYDFKQELAQEKVPILLDNDKEKKIPNEDIPSSDTHLDLGPLACTACGVLGFASMAIIQPCQEAATVLCSSNYNITEDYFVTSGRENVRYSSASGGASTTDSETPVIDDKNGLDSKNVYLKVNGPASFYHTTCAYQHANENMDSGDTNAVVHIDSLESFGKIPGSLSKSNDSKEFYKSVAPNNACIPKTLSVDNNLGKSQMSSLDLLAATYGDSIDSDEEDDSNITDTSNPVFGPSIDAFMSENSHDLCGLADEHKVDVCVSQSQNKQRSPQLSYCMLIGEVKKEETHDVLISGELKPENKCSIVDTDPNIIFSNFMGRDNDINGDVCIHSWDQYPQENRTFNSDVAENHNGVQGELNATCIQVSVVEENSEPEKDILAPPVSETSLNTNVDMSLKETLCGNILPSSHLGDPSKEMSGKSKDPSHIIVSTVGNTEDHLIQIQTNASKSELEMKPESKLFARALGNSDLDGCTHYSDTPSIYNYRSATQVSSHCQSMEMNAGKVDNISMPVISNKRQNCDTVKGNMSHVAEKCSLQEKIYDTSTHRRNAASLWKPAKGFLRPRVFCLEHALEIEEQLKPMGGANLLLLCHLNYPIMEQQARLVADEIGKGYSWKDIPFRNAAAKDIEIIHSAVDGEDTELASSDWPVQLGMSLHYSVKLCKSPLYSKQMPYNPVLEALFINSLLNNNSPDHGFESLWDTDIKKKGKKSKHKRITVAGKWCGRVWMVNQVHPYLRSHEVHPLASFDTLETLKIGVNQELRHSCKHMVQVADCKSIQGRNTITSEEYTAGPFSGGPAIGQIVPFMNSSIIPEGGGSCEEDCHLNQYTVEDADSKLIFKPRMTITSDKHVSGPLQEVPPANLRMLTGGNEASSEDSLPQNCIDQHADCQFGLTQIREFTCSEQALVTSAENTPVLISRRADLKRRRHLEEQTNDMKAQLSESTTDSTGGRTSLCNQLKENEEACLMTNDADPFSTHPKINEHVKPTVTCLSHKKQRKKVDGHGNYVQAQKNHIQKDISEADKEIQHPSKIYEENSGCISQNSQGIADSQLLVLDSCDITHTQDTEFSARSKNNRQSHLKDGVEVPTNQGSQVQVPTNQGSQVQCLEITAISKSQIVSNPGSFTGEIEGGPCTRLRPRQSKPKTEVINKGADKGLQQLSSSKTISKGKKKVAKVFASKNVEEKNKFHCDTDGCTMSFPSKRDLELHKDNICTFKGCGKHFFSHKYLVQHRRVHLADRPLSCPWPDCEMTFKWPWARTEHMRVHTGARPYVCSTAGCGQTFRFVSDFSRHKRKTGHSQHK